MSAPTSLRVGLAFLLVCGCATPSSSSRATPPEARTAEWRSPLHRDHPLVGRIWDARRNRQVDEPTLLAELSRVRFVLLGERHDNPDHHRLQAELVRGLTASGREPVLAFEMLDTEQQAAVDEALARAPGDPDAIAQAVAWEKSGWPDWSLYRPIFAVGTERGLPILGANLPRRQVRELVTRGPEALAPETRARLGLDTPLPEAVDRAMRAEMHESHCGHLPESMLAPMVLAQRARDAQMADRLLSTSAEDGAILITGAGHARTDRGVPADLVRRAPEQPVLAVAFLEVSPEAREPSDYAPTDSPGKLPYDYVWFTPAAEREDPCAAFRSRENPTRK
ncbi:ChaN family lipoprotein [Archangium violaceum]|uniref:ChaN family lipoprotein n=1 Tax=Archangium violaceum TaxID=83451 RepID=UPI001950AEF2|nr:ChaN family lipoprotein [Archangium violaceum]QRN96898.1 ChaN family lipoprotein [Archangium violaceum]